MGRFARFLLGKTSFVVDGETISLNKITVEDIQKIVDLSKVKENEIIGGVKILTDILQKSLTEEPREELESFVVKNYASIVEELTIALGWTTREKLEVLKKETLVNEKK